MSLTRMALSLWLITDAKAMHDLQDMLYYS